MGQKVAVLDYKYSEDISHFLSSEGMRIKSEKFC